MNHFARAVLTLAALALAVRAEGAVYSLNADWRFTKASKTIPLSQAKASVETNGVKVEDPAFDDSAWEVVSVPHPINAHDSFDEHAVDAGEASFWRGMAFYRKRFALDAAPKGKAFITFETVRQSVYLWVNGKFAGYYEAGIAPCAFDVTALLKEGENVLCVATDNCAARGTKLFMRETIPGHEPGDMSGAAYQWNTTDFNEVQGGLVGNVSLVVKDSKTYLTLPYYNNLKTVGTYVTAKDFDFEKGAATICVKAEVRNESGVPVKAKLDVLVRECLTGGSGVSPLRNKEDAVHLMKRRDAASPSHLMKRRDSASPSYIIAPASDAGRTHLTALESDVYENAPQPTRVVSPETVVFEAACRASGLVFWSPDTPHLYDVVVSLVGEDGKVLDAETIRTGFREVKYDAASGGLKINGKNTWLTGYAQRSTDEWAAIGVAPDWLQDYDAELIRKSNANFVRWMHVAPKPAPVRAYDKFGIVNAAPAGDKEGDVSGRAWAQRVEAMRDAMIYFRNSPSVVFWEAGNNQISPVHMREMVELKKQIDPDGFRFMGCRTLQTKEQVAEAEYVGTMLHRHEMPAFNSMKALGKFVPMMETEYARQESPRRSWDDYTPPDYDYRGRYLNGGKKETGFDVYDQTQEDFALSTAKEYAEFYGARASGRGAKTYSAVAALCWTDSNQHGRQSFSENCRSSGRVDAVRLPKVNFDVFRVMQSEDPAVMLVGHWSYPKLAKDNYMYPVKKYNGHFMEETGEMAQRDPLHKTVYAIGSVHCASVELVVNGKSKGVVTKPDHVFVYAFPNVDITESGTAEVVARDNAGKEIARHTVKSFVGEGKVETAVTTGPQGWLADGSDIAMIDFRLVDTNGTIHPFASDKISFELSFEPDKHTATSNFKLSTSNSPVFMGGWNSGVFGEASPIGKDFVNLECGMVRVFVKAGRTPGNATLTWRCAKGQSGQVLLELKPFEVKGGISAAPQQEYPANRSTFARRTSAEAVQDLASSDSAKDVPYTIRVNGAPVAFAKGMGEPVKPDDNTGVCCAYEPVLAALKAAGAKLEYTVEPKRIPANKKWLRKLSSTPFVPMVTVKAGGREIDACAGFTELFLDNGKDKNLTNCEIYGVGKKNQKVVCGELAALVGYIPGVKITVDEKTKTIELCVAAHAAGHGSKWNRYQSNTPLDVGNYDVTYTLGSDKAAKYWIKFEGRRIAVSSVETLPGERKSVSFTARVKGPIANGKGPFKEAPYPDCLNLTVITDGAEPPKPEIVRNDTAPTIYLCGDSTVTDQQSEPWGSWGQCAPLMLGKGVAVANFARSGLTTETFWKQGRLAKICAHARKGDVVLVQFGHNDQKRDNLKPNADGGYERFLNRYIDEIRKTGADVVLITPVERLRYDEASGVQQPRTLEDYADAVKRVAAARGVPVIDLGAASYRVYGALGPDGAKKLFAKTDRTHHNIYGAMVMARFVMNELVNIHQEFKPFFSEKYAGFDPSNPPKEEYVPASGELDLTRPEGDGRDLQAEIDEIAKAGGGTLRLKAGTYKTGALFFKPGVNLHLEKGATILGTDEASGYPMRETRIEGETCEYYPALINADHCDGFTITGEGVIDGHGANTWEEFWRRRAEARKEGGDFRNKALMRPRVLYVSRSKNIDVSGVTFKNSKFWTTHFYDCEDVVVHDCSIVADVLKDSQGKELKGPSTDAIDVDKCRRFTVRNVDIAVNDDGVAVKGGKGPWADDYGKFPGNGPSSDVLVENCTFRWPTHSALTLGSECPAATNVTMRNCTMDGCVNMVNLKMRTDTPQHYANVLVEGCTGKCKTFFRVQPWSQYHDAQGRTAAELMSFVDGVTLRNNVVEAEKGKEVVWRSDVFRIANLVFEGNKVNGKDVE